VTLPVKQRPTTAAVSAVEDELFAWDVRDAVVLSLQVRNTGAEAVTLSLKRRIDPAEPWGPSPLLVNTPSGDGVLQPGEAGAVDIDCGANLEVALFGRAAVVSSTVVVTARPDEGSR
jgi:hypothetical protein